MKINQIWTGLKDLGVIEVRVNGYTEYSDHAVDCFYGHEDYTKIYDEYQIRAERDLLENFKDWDFTDLKITIVEDHHCIAELTGYVDGGFEDEEDDNGELADDPG